VYGNDARISIPHLIGIDCHFLLYVADHARGHLQPV
jgi:hypothetical protein